MSVLRIAEFSSVFSTGNNILISQKKTFYGFFFVNSPNSQIVELKPLRNNETKILIKNLKGSVDGLKVHDSNDQGGSR